MDWKWKNEGSCKILLEMEKTVRKLAYYINLALNLCLITPPSPVIIWAVMDGGSYSTCEFHSINWEKDDLKVILLTHTTSFKLFSVSNSSN